MGPSFERAATRSGLAPDLLVESLGARRAERLWRRIRALRQCTLTTRTPYGEPHERMLRMQNRSLDADEPLWFFIERGSDLVLDVHAHPQVQLEFVDRDGARVQIDGRASVQGCLEHLAFSAAAQHWRLPAWPTDEAQHLTLLRVDIERVREVAPTEAANAASMQQGLAFA